MAVARRLWEKSNPYKRNYAQEKDALKQSGNMTVILLFSG
jgi:hypothetical protein